MRRSFLAAHIFSVWKVWARPLAASCVLTFRAALCFFCGRSLRPRIPHGARIIGELYCSAPCSGREESSSHAAAGSSAAVHSRMQ